jgi:hypothetical protein
MSRRHTAAYRAARSLRIVGKGSDEVRRSYDVRRGDPERSDTKTYDRKAVVTIAPPIVKTPQQLKNERRVREIEIWHQKKQGEPNVRKSSRSTVRPVR